VEAGDVENNYESIPTCEVADCVVICNLKKPQLRQKTIKKGKQIVIHLM